MWTFSTCCESIMILWPWQKTQCRQLTVLNWKYPSFMLADTFFFFLVIIICYPCDKKVGGDRANCEDSGSQESLGSHPKRWKDKPWTYYLTSPRFRFPIISEMRRTLIIYPTKELKGTTRKSIGSTLNSSEVSFYRSSKPLIKEHVHTFLRLQWVVCGWDNV